MVAVGGSQMNWLGLAAMVGFLIAWMGGVGLWFICAYHVLMYHFRFWQSKPKAAQIFANIFWFRKGFAGLRSAWDSCPDAARYHRSKALKLGVAFIICCATGMIFGGVGALWGGLRNGAS